MLSTAPLKKTRKTNSTGTLKKRRNSEAESNLISILSLPDELLLTCISRLSRLYYPILSLVSKRFRSLLASPELYKMRSRSGRTESCLYVAFDCPRGSLWFTLSRNPADEYVLTRVPTNSNSGRARFPSLVAIGSDIYNIAEGESFLSSQCSRVSIMDCRSHTWRQGPSFPLELGSLFTCTVIDRKIYVAVTIIPYDGKSCSEMVVKVFDTDTETWDHVPLPSCEFFSLQSACIDGMFHLVTDQGLLAYDPKEATWSKVQRGLSFLVSNSYCGIGNVLYCGRNGCFRWYDSEAKTWRELKGLVGLPKIHTSEFAHCGVRLADFGGKLAVLWEEPFPDTYYLLSVIPSDKKMIWCAVIALERRTDCEIWGQVEWFDRVLDVPQSNSPWKALAATV